MMCRLYIKQATSGTSVVEEEEEEEAEWVEYKIKETNMFTVDKYQQVRLVMLSCLYHNATSFEFVFVS